MEIELDFNLQAGSTGRRHRRLQQRRTGLDDRQPTFAALSSLPGMHKYRHGLTTSNQTAHTSPYAGSTAVASPQYQRQHRTPLPGLDIFHHHRRQQTLDCSSTFSAPQSQPSADGSDSRKRNADQISRNPVRADNTHDDDTRHGLFNAAQPETGELNQGSRMKMEQQAAAALLLDLSIGKTHGPEEERPFEEKGQDAKDVSLLSKESQDRYPIKSGTAGSGGSNETDLEAQAGAFKRRRTRSLDCLP